MGLSYLRNLGVREIPLQLELIDSKGAVKQSMLICYASTNRVKRLHASRHGVWRSNNK